MVRSVARDFPSGNRHVDAGNEGLCFLLERLFDPMVECRRQHGACDHTACTKIGALLTYLRRQFSAQEALMHDHDHPERESHAADHARLMTELTAMQDARVCGDRDRLVVHGMVTRWTRRHVMSCDRLLGTLK